MDKLRIFFIGFGALLFLGGCTIVSVTGDYVLFLAGEGAVIAGFGILSMFFMSYASGRLEAVGRFGLTALGLSLLTIGVILVLLYPINKYYPIYGGVMVIFGLEILMVSGRTRV